MKNNLISILLAFICFSCTETNKTDSRKEIFKLVLKDRIRLDSSVQVIKESNDSIGIFNLTLIENSYIDIEIDTVKNRIGIFSFNAPPLGHPFYTDSINYIVKQIENIKSSDWDTTSLNLSIEIDSPLKELNDSIETKTQNWISNNVKEKAFLQISEPIFNVKGEVLISAQITLENYKIDKTYILQKVNDQWEILDSDTLVGKYSEPKIEEIKNPDGTISKTETRYLIVLGYYDI